MLWVRIFRIYQRYKTSSYEEIPSQTLMSVFQKSFIVQLYKYEQQIIISNIAVSRNVSVQHANHFEFSIFIVYVLI